MQPTPQFITHNLEGCQTVLEAGCGPGRILHYLGENGYLPVGIDCSLTALLEARAHLPQGRLVLGDVTRLPFGDETFDAYISLGVIEHFPDAEVDQCLTEARRILRPGGGTLVISVPHIHPLARLGHPLKPLYRRLRGLPEPHEDEHEPPGRYYRHDELVDALRRNGFEIRQVAPLGHEYAFHSFSGMFRKRNAYHDVPQFVKALSGVCRLLAPWATAFHSFVAATRT